jgi:hypothetical protein
MGFLKSRSAFMDKVEEEKPDTGHERPIRGLILTSTQATESGGASFSGAVDLHQLRHALLFWDKLVWPRNNIANPNSPDLDFLEGAKILERPRYAISMGRIDANFLVQIQLTEFQKRSDAGTGVWDICQNTSALLSAVAKETDADGVGFELISAIPVPDKDVPLNEILEFKQRRTDEFLRLRAEVDGLGSKLIAAGTNIDSALTEIDKACADVLRISSEWQFPVRLADLKMALDLKPFKVLAGGVAASLAASVKGLSATQIALAGIGGAAGAAESAFKITSGIGLQSIKRRKSPFAYVAHIHKEAF